MISQVAVGDYMSFDNVQEMGWWNLAWVLLVAFIFIAWRAKKIGVTSIGKNEWGMLEVFGFPLIPIPFGIWLYIKGVIHVKQVSTAPTRVDIASRREINDRVLWVSITFLVVVGRKGNGSLWQRFLNRRRDLIAALYNALDENIDDAENPERITQTRDILEAATRDILKGTDKTIDDLTVKAINDAVGGFLQQQLGEYVMNVFIREDAPVDGQLWKEGRGTDPGQENEFPPIASPGLTAIGGGSA